MALGYERDYFIARQHGWTASAEVVAQRIMELFPITSVVEVGCGTANLLAAFRRRGAADVLGLDGPNVPYDLLCIPQTHVRRWDLDQLAPLPRRFDLACTLEVAEHLPAARAADFVRLLVEAAPVVLFGAAIPGQGGPGHVNEQRQSWWAERFAAHGYLPVDCIRPVLWRVPDMEWYYAQNILVYCRPERIPAGHAPVAARLYLDLVDERVVGPLRRGPDSIKGALRGLARDSHALARALIQRLAFNSGSSRPARGSVH